jgi:sugar lactone lactonase YvrE
MNRNQHLFISDDTGTRSVYELNPGPDGIYETADDIVTSFSTETFGSNDPEGVTFDPSQGVLFIVDGVNNEVYRVSPGDNGLFDGVGDEVTNFDTAQHGILDPEGITINPATGNLYIVGEPTDTLAEMTTSGDLVQTIDISAANATKPAGLVYAPSSQNQGEWDIYVAARGVDNNSDPNENDGKVYELTMPSVGPAPPIANDDSANTTIASAVTIDVAATQATVPSSTMEMGLSITLQIHLFSGKIVSFTRFVIPICYAILLQLQFPSGM